MEEGNMKLSALKKNMSILPTERSNDGLKLPLVLTSALATATLNDLRGTLHKKKIGT